MSLKAVVDVNRHFMGLAWDEQWAPRRAQPHASIIHSYIAATGSREMESPKSPAHCVVALQAVSTRSCPQFGTLEYHGGRSTAVACVH
jgi:hypothetical protein